MSAYEAFQQLDLRVGRIIEAEPHPAARKPAYRLRIDFGPLGVKVSSAQLTDLYRTEDLGVSQVIAAVNLGTRSIAGFQSDVLVVELPDELGHVVLLASERDVP